MPASNRSLGATGIGPERKSQFVLSEQVRLLYANSTVSTGVTILAAAVLGRLQWGFIPSTTIVIWWLYMVALSFARHALARSYAQSPAKTDLVTTWRNAYAAGSALAGAGWGAAGILLYPTHDLTRQIFLVFVLGGMMLGAAFLLAPRPEAFLAFLVPTGVAPAIRFLAHGDDTHLAMGLLSLVFTLAAVITTGRIYRTIDSLLRLQFENRDLVNDLQSAKNRADALNEELEHRVEERTAELHESNEQLRSEIQQRQRMEDELVRARKLESLGVLAGGIAHDFNNFLTVVQGNIEMAKGCLDPGDPVFEILEQSAGACQRAAFLSSQLLTFAKGGVPVRRVVSITELLSDAVQLARAGAPISIAVDIEPGLWFANVDPGQIGQVLHNLLLNARQAMPEGGIIEVRARNMPSEDEGSGPRVRITIRDYGCGIAPDVLPRIFDPYFTTKSSGSGLGLATSHSIISKHGGRISVESNPGEGTLVTVDLPAANENPRVASRPVRVLQKGRERILVMDDEDALRRLLRTALSRLGYEVHAARDGAEAITLYEKAREDGRPFDAVILDLTVSGGMGGLEAAAKLREIDPSARLIVSSGYSASPVMSDFMQYGFDAVIPKPWTASDVTEVLRKVLVPDPQRKSDS